MRIFFIIITTVVTLFSLPLQVSADIYGYMDADGYWCFDNSKDSYKKYNQIIIDAAEKFKVESSLIIAIIKAESDFNHTAVSSKGAKGLMQLMPETASKMNLEEPFSPKENIMAGTCYFRLLLERFNNDKKLALAAYNAGPEIVEAYNGVPPFPETRDFIIKVFNFYNQYSQGH